MQCGSDKWQQVQMAGLRPQSSQLAAHVVACCAPQVPTTFLPIGNGWVFWVFQYVFPKQRTGVLRFSVHVVPLSNCRLQNLVKA
eukprot:3095833-Amphidinium_carterae.1